MANLVVPVPLTTPGPTYASDVSTDLTTLQGHNHTGNGFPLVPVAGLDINADLPLGNTFNLTQLRSARFYNNSATLALGSDIGCAYEKSGDLWYNNSSGTPVQITNGASLNASTTNGIQGLASPAEVLYSSGSESFTFFAATSPSVMASVATGPLSVLDTASGVSNAVILESPVSLAASVVLTLPSVALTMPTAVPSSGTKEFATITSAGVQSFSLPPSMITFGANAGVTSGTGFLNVGGPNQAIGTNATTTIVVMPQAGNCIGISAYQQAGGSTGTTTYGIIQNGSAVTMATAISCNVTGGNNSSSNPFTFAQGDQITISITPSGILGDAPTYLAVSLLVNFTAGF